MIHDWATLELEAIPGAVWGVLSDAVADGSHPWRTPVLATLGDLGPDARVVVLRAVTLPGFELIAFSDHQSDKIAELTADPRSMWVFYHPGEKVQVRAHAGVRMHHQDPVAQTYWHRLPAAHRGRYGGGGAPGSPRSAPGRGMPSGEGDIARFAVLIGDVQAMDFLWIGAEPHRRARFRRTDTRWEGVWVEP